MLQFFLLTLLKSMASGHLKIKRGLVMYLYWPFLVTLLRVHGKLTTASGYGPLVLSLQFVLQLRRCHDKQTSSQRKY